MQRGEANRRCVVVFSAGEHRCRAIEPCFAPQNTATHRWALSRWAGRD